MTSCFTESDWADSLAFGSMNDANDFANTVRLMVLIGSPPLRSWSACFSNRAGKSLINLRPSADALDIKDFAAKDISMSG